MQGDDSYSIAVNTFINISEWFPRPPRGRLLGCNPLLNHYSPPAMSDAPDKQDVTEKQDWRSTVFLPKTDFPMKAGLPQKEPLTLAKWQASDLYGQVREARAGRKKF